jgi:hypothetical protein
MPRRDTVPPGPIPCWPRAIVVFGLLFGLYQASEYLQTRETGEHLIGPALMLLVVVVAWPLGRWLGWRGYDAYALDLRPFSLVLLVAGVSLSATMKLLSLVAGERLGIHAPVDQGLVLNIPVVAGIALSTFVPSVAEDILTRGLLLRALPYKFAGWSFVVISALLYMANHVWRFDWGWTEQLRLFCFGLAYAAAAWRWQTLWAAVALHWGWNLGSALADGLMPLEVLDVTGARLLSAVAHLLLLGLILVLPRKAQTV